MRQILSITRKELQSYFGSPLAIIFLGTFLAAELFIFFTIETFFARGIADVRPLFAWMPLLLIFLLAALTMRQWSEEQRSGTLEILLTLPVNLIQLVLGKFLAVMAIIALALALTLPLPITVSQLGSLDWGPVIGGYLAALLMAAAYAAIGLFVSSRTDNQIVAVISTVLLGGAFYLIGSAGVTDFVGGSTAELLRALGTGSRFESIERGVIDLRDLVYYLSLAGFFLALNVYSLDRLRWSQRQTAYRRSFQLTTALVLANFVLANVWLYPLQGLRLDLTAQREFTLSQVSKDLLANLQEPLLVRALISEKTHPLLSPLIPQIRDLLREYEIAAAGMVTAEVVDPLSDPELEAEANQTYGIRPTPFQISGRYEASLINSYFDILVRYGDQYEVLGFSDLIEVTSTAQGMDVRLRNLEYDLTGAIKKVVFGFQSIEAVLASLEQPVMLTIFETPNTLPAAYQPYEQAIRSVAAQIQSESSGKFQVQMIDPDASNSPLDRTALLEQYGIQPIPVSLFSTDSFYLHLLLQNGDQAQVIYPSGEGTEADVRTAIESALKRTTSGFLKVVGVWSPPETPTQDVFGQMQEPLSTFRLIRQQLGQDYTVQSVDLATGSVPAEIDVLLLVAPQNFTELELFAVDQYLMRGGSLIVAASAYRVEPDPFSGSLALAPIQGSLNTLLAHYGVSQSTALVMDGQNTPFPVVVNRDVGGFTVQEIQAVDYPFFVDIRQDGMELKSPILANVPAVTLNWASPLTVALPDDSPLEATVLLRSTDAAWLRTDTTIQPDFQLYPELGFPVEGAQAARTLAVSLQGDFTSYFDGKSAPLPPTDPTDPAATASQPIQAVIPASAAPGRLVVIGSAEFLDDFVLDLSSRITQDRYLNNLTFVQNAVDWAVEDLELLSIRSRGSFTRVLAPLEQEQQTLWEFGNYAAALALLLGVYLAWQARRRSEQPLALIPAAGDIQPGQEVSHD